MNYFDARTIRQHTTRCAKQRTNKPLSYYDRGARQRPPLSVGDTVRTRWDRKKPWEKAEVIKVLPHRSYQLKVENNTTRRRTLRHVHSHRSHLSSSERTTNGYNHRQPQPRQRQLLTGRNNNNNNNVNRPLSHALVVQSSHQPDSQNLCRSLETMQL